jgi:hypothetical protein
VITGDMTMTLVISETLPPAEIKARVVEDVKFKIRQFDQRLMIIDLWINSSSMQISQIDPGQLASVYKVFASDLVVAV